ncbi:hypothetical protein Lal_00035562, partial [Lupinus albus]
VLVNVKAHRTTNKFIRFLRRLNDGYTGQEGQLMVKSLMPKQWQHELIGGEEVFLEEDLIQEET